MNDKITKTSLGKGGKGHTDWKRVDAFTDEEIAQAITEDPDTFEPEPEWLQGAMILRPGQPKLRVTAYFDQEVVECSVPRGEGIKPG